MSELSPEQHVDSMIGKLDELKTSIDNNESVQQDDERVKALQDMAAEQRELTGVNREKLERLKDLVGSVPEDLIGRESVEAINTQIVTAMQETTHDAVGSIVGPEVLQGTPIEDTAAPEEKGFFGMFSAKGLGDKIRSWQNKLAFSVGASLEEIEKSGFFSKNMMLKFTAMFIGKNRVQLAEAMKLNQFEGIEEIEGYSIKNLEGVHTLNFAKIPLNVFFLKVSKKARERFPNKKELSYKELTEVAESLKMTDFSPEEIAAGEKKEPTPEAETGSPVDVLNAYVPAKVAGYNFRVYGNNAILEGAVPMQLKGLEDLKITKSLLQADGQLQLAVQAKEGTYSGTVDAEMLKRIVSNTMNTTDKISVSQGSTTHDLTLDTSIES